MSVKNNYIESLDIPQSDKDLLYKFEDMMWEDIHPERCVSERGRQETLDIMHRNYRRAECACGID